MKETQVESETHPQAQSDKQQIINTPQPIYLNLYFFELNMNLVYSYCFLITSMLLNLINRILYQIYDFKFNFTLILLQQLSAILIFNFIFTKSKNFNREVGKCSFSEFNERKFQLIFVALLFLSNILCSFLGNQKVNTVM